MQIVIDIPEEAYQGVVNGRWGNGLLGVLCTGVENGILLPKGHGRLIDANALINSTDKEEVHLYEIALAPTIIKADKESEDEE